MFKLDPTFVEEFATKQPDWGPVGYVVYKRTYALPKPDGTTEEWYETCERVINGMYQIQEEHCAKYSLPWDNDKAQASAQDAYARMFEFKWLPPGRGLSKMGTDYIKNHGAAALNNCGFVTTENLNASTFHVPFVTLFDLSCLGVGVGFDTLGAGKVIISSPERRGSYRVGDSRTEQAQFVGELLKGYAADGVVPGVVDYSEIRPAGSPILGFGGTASGPEPLRQLVADIHEILGRRAGHPITATDIVDLFNAIGRMVVSGGVRRTAEISLGPPTTEYLNLKNPEVNQERLSKWGWCSNNSIRAAVGQDYSEACALTKVNGEPGFFWLKNAQEWGRGVDKLTTSNKTDPFARGTNPCSEQTLEDMELCTLVETFPSRHDNLRDYARTLKFAYLYAKTVTLMPTHNPRINAVMMKNRRIGCSMSGIVDAIKKHGYGKFRDWMDAGYQEVQYRDEEYSNWLGVPRSIKTTSVKPSGTISKLPGVSEGCHFPYAEFYWQVIRFSTDSPLLPRLRQAGYEVVDLPNEPNTVAVYFPSRVENFDRAESDVTLWEKLKLAVELQKWWADNQVSCTVTFKPEEADDIERALGLFDEELKGISFLPSYDHGYEHAPKQPIDEETYRQAVNKLQPLDLSGIMTKEAEDKFCDGEACEL